MTRVLKYEGGQEHAEELETSDLPDNLITDEKLGMQVKVGNLTELGTSAKTNIVTAINEILASLSNNVTGVGTTGRFAFWESSSTLGSVSRMSFSAGRINIFDSTVSTPIDDCLFAIEGESPSNNRSAYHWAFASWTTAMFWYYMGPGPSSGWDTCVHIQTAHVDDVALRTVYGRVAHYARLSSELVHPAFEVKAEAVNPDCDRDCAHIIRDSHWDRWTSESALLHLENQGGAPPGPILRCTSYIDPTTTEVASISSEGEMKAKGIHAEDSMKLGIELWDADSQTTTIGDDFEAPCIVLVSKSVTTPDLVLPPATESTGKQFTIKAASGMSLTLNGNASETIDGSNTLSLSALEWVVVVCDGTQWWIVSQG